MKSQILLAICIFSLLAMLAHADLDDRSILTGGSARLVGLGSAGVAGPGDSTSLFWNPAIFGILNQTELSFTDAPLQPQSLDREGFLAILFDTAQLDLSLDLGSLGVATWFDGWGDDPEKNRIIRTGLGIPLGYGFSIGTALVHERRNTDLGTDVGWGFDLGVLWSRQAIRFGRQLRLGMVGQRLAGRRDWSNKASVRTPLRLSWGLGYQPDQDTWFTADLTYTHDLNLVASNRLRAHLGLERWLLDRFAFRIGYTGIAHYDSFTRGEWSRGLGLRTDTAQFDYAYVSGGSLDQGFHWMTATLRWEWPRKRVAETTEPPPVIIPPEPVEATLETIPPIFSPNGDGRNDVVKFKVQLSPRLPWFLSIQDMQGTSIRNITSTTPVWNGLDMAGQSVPDGIYRVVLLQGGQSSSSLASQSLTVDTTPPVVTLSVEPLLLMSQQSQDDMVIDVAKVHIQVEETNALSHWSLTITDAQGNQLADFTGEQGPPQTVIWDNWQENVMSRLAGQKLQCAMRVQDEAGNVASEVADLMVVDLGQLGSRREKRGIVMTLPGVAFDTNSAEIKPEFFDALREAANAIRAYPDARVRVEGHTDDRGMESYNMNLSLARANAVMDYLIETFEFDPIRFNTVGYGETRPIADNEIEEGRQKNRRVEIVLLLTEDEGEALSEPTGRSTGNAIDKTPEVPQAKYTVSVGSFRDRKTAEVLLTTIQQLQLPHEIRLLKVPMNNHTLYRVTIGAFREEAPAEQLADKLEREHGLLPVVMPYE